MDRRDFVNLFTAMPAAFVATKSFSHVTTQDAYSSSFASSFVTISSTNPFYFQLSNGNAFVLNGPCLAGAADMNTMEGYLKKLSSNYGNFARVWLCNRLFEVEKKFGEYDEEQAKKIDQLLTWATKYNVKLKLCLDNTRQIIPD